MLKHIVAWTDMRDGVCHDLHTVGEWFVLSVYIFGKGKIFHDNLEKLLNEYNIVGIFDNAVDDEQVYQRNGIRLIIYNPCKIGQLEEHNIVIMIEDFIPVWKQLKELGVQDRRIEIPLQFVVNSKNFDWKDSFLESVRDKLILRTTREDYSFDSKKEWEVILRSLYKQQYQEINAIQTLGVRPVSRFFGCERGMAVDRHYISLFLENNAADIKGDVLEVGDSFYTDQYGADKVVRKYVLHVKGWGQGTIKGNFETGEGIQNLSVDCVICTQVLQYIYDVESALKHIHEILKPGGVALLTVPGIKSISLNDDRNWNEYWSFTPKSMSQLCSVVTPNYSVQYYGNAKVATAYLYGLCKEELLSDDFEYNDDQFPFLICAKIRKTL